MVTIKQPENALYGILKAVYGDAPYGLETQLRFYRQAAKTVLNNIFVGQSPQILIQKALSARNQRIRYGLCQSLKQAGAANPRVLIVDTDSQAHATLTTTGSKDYSRHKSICAVLSADRKEMVQVLSQVIVESHWLPELHVLPSSTELEQTERELFSAAGAPYRLADALSTIRHHYAAIVIDTRPSFSLMTEMSLLAATDAIIALEPRYLETVGLQSVINKIMEIREGWRHPDLRLSGIVVTKMDRRVKGHIEMIEQIKQHPTLGKLVCGVIPANEAVAYAHRSHMSIYEYDPSSAAAEAYAHMVCWMLKRLFVKEPV